MLPSLYVSGDKAQAWSLWRAAACGAAVGAAAALLKTLGPSHQTLTASLPEIAAAALGFALLCLGAAALRNLLARRLIWPDIR